MHLTSPACPSRLELHGRRMLPRPLSSMRLQFALWQLSCFHAAFPVTLEVRATRRCEPHPTAGPFFCSGSLTQHPLVSSIPLWAAIALLLGDHSFSHLSLTSLTSVMFILLFLLQKGYILHPCSRSGNGE